MPTTRLTEKISDIVRRQFPEHIQTDYDKFISFVEAYYRFIEQDQGAHELIQNARSYSDIDKTASSFIQYFLKQYAPNIPIEMKADKALLIKQIKSLYESKGSEISFKILFRVLFNSGVTIKYPYENVLRPSDGQWLQRSSVRVKLVSGSLSGLSSRYLTLVKNNITYKTPIISVRRLTTTITELFLDPTTLGPYSIGDTVTVSSASSVIMTGTILPTTTSYTIDWGGEDFKVGQIFTVNYQGAVGTLVKVASVDSSGAITSLQFINYGYGFTINFATNLDATSTVSSTIGNYVSKNGGFGDVSTAWRYSSSGASRYFFSDYVTPGYTGEAVTTADGSYTISPGSGAGVQSLKIATITFKLGSVGTYPGTYISNRGFLSEEQIRLQDDKLYKPFAYQVNSEVDIINFLSIVKTLVHPAGQDLFSNRLLENVVDLRSSIDTEASPGFTSSVTLTDSIQITVV